MTDFPINIVYKERKTHGVGNYHASWNFSNADVYACGGTQAASVKTQTLEELNRYSGIFSSQHLSFMAGTW